MYAQIALGKSSAMDVVGGESSGMPGQLLVLLPGLFVLQGWQVYMGVKMVVQTGQAVVNSEGWLVSYPVHGLLSNVLTATSVLHHRPGSR
jgi:hypothetical protein